MHSANVYSSNGNHRKNLLLSIVISRIMKFPWSVVHFRQFNPNLHNIFAEDAFLCQELEKSPVCMDDHIRISPGFHRKAVLFLCRTRLQLSRCIPSRRFAFVMLAQKQVLTAICITFHTNFTIRPGDHSNFSVCYPFKKFCSTIHWSTNSSL